jgi:hypothetical protein
LPLRLPLLPPPSATESILAILQEDDFWERYKKKLVNLPLIIGVGHKDLPEVWL